MKRSKLWVVLSLVLFFGAGVVAGIFVEKGILGRHTPSHKPPAPPSMERWAKDLGLTAEQQTKIQDIFKRNEVRIKTLRSDFFKHLDEIRAQLKSEIDAVLTPEQRIKQDAMIKKHIEERRKEYDRDRTRESHSGDPARKENANEKENDPEDRNPGSHRGGHPGFFPY